MSDSGDLHIPSDKKQCKKCNKILPLEKFQILYDKNKNPIGHRDVHRRCERSGSSGVRLDSQINDLKIDLNSMDISTGAILRAMSSRLSTLEGIVKRLQQEEEKRSKESKE
jgi:hypothetical protein